MIGAPISFAYSARLYISSGVVRLRSGSDLYARLFHVLPSVSLPARIQTGTPAHKMVAVDVFVVFGQIQTTAQHSYTRDRNSLQTDPAWLWCNPAMDGHTCSEYHVPSEYLVVGPPQVLHSNREAYVFQTQSGQCLEAEYVTHQ